MHRPDPFEARFSAAVRAFADDADTRVDAVAMAERARRLDRSLKIGWLRRIGFAAAAALVAVAVLGWLGFQHQEIPGPGSPPTPSAAPTASPTPALIATASVLPGGWVLITGTEVYVVGAAGATSSGGHTNGIQIATSDQTDYAGATGIGKLTLSADTSGELSLEWGTYRLENAHGSWAGNCRGSSSAGKRDLTCWLAGSGDFKGFTYSFFLRTDGTSGQIQGLIYPGSPPEP
jgi:hypothetical protein